MVLAWSSFHVGRYGMRLRKKNLTLERPSKPAAKRGPWRWMSAQSEATVEAGAFINHTGG